MPDTNPPQAMVLTHDLGVDPSLKQFIEEDVLAGRDAIRTQIDDWHKARRCQPHDREAYRAFLEEIGYIVPRGGDFSIEPANTDREIAHIPGPMRWAHRPLRSGSMSGAVRGLCHGRAIPPIDRWRRSLHGAGLSNPSESTSRRFAYGSPSPPVA